METMKTIASTCCSTSQLPATLALEMMRRFVVMYDHVAQYSQAVLLRYFQSSFSDKDKDFMVYPD